MLKVAKESEALEFICTTECGMIERIKRELPGKKFFTVCSLCFDMKKITLESVENALITAQHEVKVPKEIAKKALQAFEEMFRLTNTSL